jgi:hypothetical protein
MFSSAATVQEHQHRVVLARAADGHEVVDAARGDVAGFVYRSAGVTEEAGAGWLPVPRRYRLS